MPLPKRFTTTVTEVVRIQVSFLTVGSENNNNKHTEEHVIFIPFKDQIYSKQGSHVSLLFGTWLGEAKVSTVNSDLTNFFDAQRMDENIK